MRPDEDIVRALVGEKHRRQYLTDADFHLTVDQLAVLLPLWIDGIAGACERSAAQREQVIDALMRRPGTPMFMYDAERES